MSEIQTTMSSRELELWGLYRSKYGPFNPVRMYDQIGAVIASQINNAFGGKAKPKDFMPYGKEPEAANEEDFISQLMATGRAKVAR